MLTIRPFALPVRQNQRATYAPRIKEQVITVRGHNEGRVSPPN